MVSSNKKILSSIKKKSANKSNIPKTKPIKLTDKPKNDMSLIKNLKNKSDKLPKTSPSLSKNIKEEFNKLPKIKLIYVFIIIIVVIGLAILGMFIINMVIVKIKGEGFNANDTSVPMSAIKNPKDHDIQAQNRCHGLGCGNFEIDVWGRADPEEHHLINDSLIIDEQNATKFRKLQVPLVPSTDPAGGTLDFIGKDPVHFLNKNISFNPQHVSVKRSNKMSRIDVGNGNLEDKHDKKPVKLTSKFHKTVANDFSDDFDNIMPGIEMFKN